MLNQRQSKFIKNTYIFLKNYHKVAESFYEEFGKTDYCSGPAYLKIKNLTHKYYSGIDGYDLCSSAALFLSESLKDWEKE